MSDNVRSDQTYYMHPLFFDDPLRKINFNRDESGALVCPNGRRFFHYKDVPVRGNKYGRTEELHMCESCEGCSLKKTTKGA